MSTDISKIKKRDLEKAAKSSKSYAEMMRKLGIVKTSYRHFKLKDQLDYFDIRFAPFKINKNLKENCFSQIRSKAQAYWLGFIAADGSVSAEGNTIRFMLSIKDEDQLDRFIDFVGGDLSAKRYSVGAFGTNKVAFQFSNKKISDSVKKWGIVSPKAKTLSLPDFRSRALDLAFLLGFYDGDGSKDSPFITCGSKKFLKQIKEKYKLPSKIVLKKNPIGQAYGFYISIAFFRELTRNYKHSMPRKRELANSKGIKDKCVCGLDKSKNSKKCKKCSSKNQVKKIKIPAHVEERLFLSNLLKNGESIENISKKVGISGTALRKRLKKMKIYHLSKYCFKSRRKVKGMIIKLYLKKAQKNMIIKKTGASKTLVSQVIAKYRKENEGYVFKARKYDYDKVFKIFLKSKNISQAARKMGMHRETVRKIIREKQLIITGN